MEANENAKINSTYLIPINTNISFASVLGEEIGGMGDTTQNSTLTATVLQPIPPIQLSIPDEYLLPIYGAILTLLIPSILKELKSEKTFEIIN